MTQKPRVFIVYWHNEPQSFNHAMFTTAQNSLTSAGFEVQTSDLHAMNFNPVSDRRNFTTVYDANYLKQQLEEIHASAHDGFAVDVKTEIEKMEWCDIMIWQFPLWWFGLPAVLKGWVDKVFAMGRTYGDTRFYENGQFKDKLAMVSTTTGGQPEVYVPNGFAGDPMAFLRPIHRGMFQFIGFKVLAPHLVHAPVHLSHEERSRELEKYAARLANIDKELPVDVGRF
jgi:NAD(P)H dehydrogenase (quinone)